ncbi:hypothetical protein H2202_007187 [Exophiala xenobiotica]|nr:hypothetical protein H2202_007187 [Exophiala xenobiotica]
MADVTPTNPSQARDDPDDSDDPSRYEIFPPPELITVNVGRDKVVYSLNRDWLVYKCPFFEKCLRSGMKEEQEKTVNLPEELPEAFDKLVGWMYTGTVGATPGWDCINAYLLADKFCMHDLQSSILDALRNPYRTNATYAIWPKTLDHVWQRSMENCELRKFCLDNVYSTLSYLYDWTPSNTYAKLTTQDKKKFDNLKADYKNELDELIQSGSPVMNALFWKMANSNTVPPNPALLLGCFYHIHKDGEKCTSSG